VTSAIEKPKQSAFRRAGKKKQSINETPKLFYTVIISNNASPKKIAADEPAPEAELGLPPQPKGYLKQSDCDWF